jgi:Ca2+-binding EF-hand superfamily protein
MFKLIDKNGDGKLSKAELKEGYENHYCRLLSDKEIDAIFETADTDRSGFIDYTEFIVATAN